MFKSVNPDRLRKTAKAASHNHVTGLSSPADSPDLPKSRRAREKALAASQKTAKSVKSIAASGIDYTSWIVTVVVTLVFWLGVIGWWFETDLVNLMLLQPIKAIFWTVTFPIRAPFKLIFWIADTISRTVANIVSPQVAPVQLVDIALPTLAPIVDEFDYVL